MRSQSKKRNIFLAISSITEVCTLHYYQSGIKIEDGQRTERNAEIKSGIERNFPAIWRVLVGVPLYSQPLFRSLFLFFFYSSFRLRVASTSYCCESEVTSCVKQACDARQDDVSSGRGAATHVVQCRRFEPGDRQVQYWEISRWAENVGHLRCETSYEGNLRGDRMLHGSWGAPRTDTIKKSTGTYRATFPFSSR